MNWDIRIHLIVGFVLIASGLLRLWAGALLVVKGEARFAYVNRPTAADHAQWDREAADIKRIKRGGEFYEPLQMFFNFPGVDQPSMVVGEDVQIDSEDPVVGVEIAGEAFAFVLDDMANPRKHIANLHVHGKAISVTYCNLVDCVRVLTQDDDQPLALSVGGLDVNNQMVLLWEGKRYGQSSLAIPLGDYPFERMQWGEWLSQYPETRVYTAANHDSAN
ncbi:MAG: hypothetical protein CMM01_06065 [Rhodopirellula sp.]|nr:hypothetical protein [Rhodopirellula sp.]OUX52152.1 MAG: hypothetical protein CBE43_01620 [Rhodopirellula sp. TMED283]